MSDLDKLTEALTSVRGHLQDLQVDQKATTHELGSTKASVQSLGQSVSDLQASVGNLQASVGNLQARSLSMESSMVALGGTFASLEQILKSLLADRERLTAIEKENAELRQTVSGLGQTLTNAISRIEVLEKRAS